MDKVSHSFGLVVDDHPLVARGIAALLGAHPMLEQVYVAASAPDALELIAQHGAPRVALVDFWLSDGSAACLVHSLQAECPDTRILAISADDRPVVWEAMRLRGAHGFVAKQQQPAEFNRAVTALLSGGTWFASPYVANGDALDVEQGVTIDAAELGLTERQAEVAALILQGLPNKRIARALEVSESTVKEHVSGIFQRLGVQTRMEVVTLLRGRRLRPPAKP